MQSTYTVPGIWASMRSESYVLRTCMAVWVAGEHLLEKFPEVY